MRKEWFRPVSVGLTLLFVFVSVAPGLAGEAEKKEAPPAKETKEQKRAEAPAEKKAAPAKVEKPAEAERPAGLVGTIVTFVPDSQTLVVDVPQGKEVLRVGATVTKKTKITVGGVAATTESLKAGARVRINFRWVANGDEAFSVDILGAKKG